ncbi:unnamed protein product [Arctogadus glacialis]
MEEIAASVVMTEHDYGSAPKPGALDAAAAAIGRNSQGADKRAVTAESGSSARVQASKSVNVKNMRLGTFIRDVVKVNCQSTIGSPE